MTTYILTRGDDTEPAIQIDERFEDELLGRLVKRNLKKFGKVSFEEGRLEPEIIGFGEGFGG